MEYPYDLGSYSCPITTTSPLAQRWFDRGLIWTYGYNHQEAIACFKQALTHDPTCAMAHWGLSYASGPNYNMPWELHDQEGRASALATAYEASQAAVAHLAGCTAPETLSPTLQAAPPPRRC